MTTDRGRALERPSGLKGGRPVSTSQDLCTLPAAGPRRPPGQARAYISWNRIPDDMQHMRPGQNKRMRGGRPNNRNKGPGGWGPNRSFDSTGPDIKLPGTASQLYEKNLG